jgi:hypothetical protein
MRACGGFCFIGRIGGYHRAATAVEQKSDHYAKIMLPEGPCVKLAASGLRRNTYSLPTRRFDNLVSFSIFCYICQKA